MRIGHIGIEQNCFEYSDFVPFSKLNPAWNLFVAYLMWIYLHLFNVHSVPRMLLAVYDSGTQLFSGVVPDSHIGELCLQEDNRRVTLKYRIHFIPVFPMRWLIGICSIYRSSLFFLIHC